MSSPQCENGFTKIANEILEALAKIRIPGRARQVLDAVLRKSYGYNRKTALFKPGELSQMTGLIKQNIATELSKLSSMNIITVTQNGYVTNKGYLMEITFNKHYTKWVRSPKKVTSPILVTEVTQKGSSGPVTPIIVKEKRKTPTHSTGKTLIPSDFSVTPEMQKWFEDQRFQYITIEGATAQFIDYWKSKGKMMKDWTATWRNGMRKQDEWAQRDGRPIIKREIKCDNNPKTRYAD